ncbi:MAG: ribosome silencing factor [Bacteroides sp.]|nr:ribosome silencing factor [Barnesiella sp.]MBD5253423.1 ribosome silencing factor [Barnesiella sp.]MBD5368911.1 ribosome silencing factor [Bacteroides sp.]
MNQPETKDTLEMIIEGLRDRKGRDITILDLNDVDSAPARTFVIASGTSTMHVSSLADNVREHLLEEVRVKPYNYDGYGASSWIVIDYGEIMVHVFLPETRMRYDLESLWSDARITRLPDEL